MRLSIALNLFRNAALALLALASTWTADARAVTINWVPVGNPGNAPDTTVMTTDGTSGYGLVAYNYRIDKYDVTNSQYAEFLNAKDASGADPLGLYNGNMSSSPFGGINFNSGALPGSKYSVISGDGSHPVNFVTWYDTLRFANWLNNGQGNGDTESGAYTLLGGTPTPSNANSIPRNAAATVFLPSENEWYKAAYYNPATNAYFQYPTSSDTAPIGSNPTALANHANVFNGGPGNLTDVGAYSGTTSPYGAFDMGGNVYQWNEALITSTFLGLRGGSFMGTSGTTRSSFRPITTPSGEFETVGFRVASTPEPSTAVLAAMGLLGLAARARRRRKRLGPS